MRFPAVLVISLIILSAVSDYLLWLIIKKHSKSKLLKYIHLTVAGLALLALFAALVAPVKSIGHTLFFTFMWSIFAYMSIYIPKAVYLIFYGLSSVPLIFKRKRVKSVLWIGAALSVITFITVWWGVIYTRNTIEIKNVQIVSDRLPASFDGFKIAQFSDIHVGSYNGETDFVEKVVNTINGLNADLVVFTGDIVNQETKELDPYIDILSGIRSKLGVYTILGNHDYGDYKIWSSDKEQAENNALLQEYFKRMKWNALNNDYCFIKQGTDSLALIGVENWGDPPFKTYCDLSVSYPNLNDDNFKILLSHNPAHWKAEIIGNTNIDLMMAGHTHAMQSQISIFGYRFSPAWFRYHEWGGLYTSESGTQKLYVNIGLGQVALPARFGTAYPEITLFELKSK